MLLIEDQVYYCNGRSTVLLEIKYHTKINHCVGRWTVLLEDKLYHWKINCDVGRSGVFSENAVMKTINRNRWKLPIKENNCKKMTA